MMVDRCWMLMLKFEVHEDYRDVLSPAAVERRRSMSIDKIEFLPNDRQPKES